MANDEANLDRDVDNIIFQIKNQGKSVKTVKKDRPELQKEDLERFVIDNASSVVMDSIEMIQDLKDEVQGDPKMVGAVSELVKATTAAIEALSKLKLSDDRIRGQRELKQMDIDAKAIDMDNMSKPGGLYISREALMKGVIDRVLENNLPQIKESPPINPPIDV